MAPKAMPPFPPTTADAIGPLGANQVPVYGADGTPVLINLLMPPSGGNDGRVRKAESDKIDVPGFPTYLQLKSYLISLQNRLCIASAWGDDAEADWIAMVW